MTRIRSAQYRWILTLLAVVCLLQTAGRGQAARPHRIAVWGSSVANGTGDEFQKEGYGGRLRELLATRGWQVLNQSKDGDNVTKMALRFAPEGAPEPDTRYLLPVNPGYVVIGLGYLNEGLARAATTQEKDAIYKKFTEGIKGFVDKARQHNITPIVASTYPTMSWTALDYEYLRKTNLLFNTWDVPSVNLLGAEDNGAGRYVEGFHHDDAHPNAAGHTEVMYAFVPTLFEALEKGKPTPTRQAEGRGYARITGGAAPLTFSPPDTMHPYALSFMVRAQADGTVAAVSGSTLAARSETKMAEARGTTPPAPFESITLSADKLFTAVIVVRNGKWTYTAANGTSVGSDIKADAQWHQIVLSHYTARGETLFFVDGKLGGKAAERLQPTRFVVGGPGSAQAPAAPAQADYQDLFIFRSALNADEAAALHHGAMVQASLEIYAPLTDSVFRSDLAVENRAQSMTAVKVGTGKITHVSDKDRTQ